MQILRHLRPEFVNRIDEIIVFRALDKEQIAEIARLLLDTDHPTPEGPGHRGRVHRGGGRADSRGGLRSRVRSQALEAHHPAPRGQRAGEHGPLGLS